MKLHQIQSCVSNRPQRIIEVRSRTSEVIYEVLVPMPDDPSNEYICGCPGFRYNGRCAHQTMAFDHRCGWSESVSPETQTTIERTQRRCPRCNGPTYMEAVIND